MMFAICGWVSSSASGTSESGFPVSGRRAKTSTKQNATRLTPHPRVPGQRPP
jgi:hypothetical protein